MKRFSKLIFCIAIIVAFCSCSRPGCSQKSGTIGRLLRPVAAFSTIVVNDNINVVLRPDSICRLWIETDEALQSSISAEVQNGQLILRNNASCSIIRRPGETITAYISLPDLNRLDYQGSGNVSCSDTFQLDYLSIEADHGAGNVHLLVNSIYTEARINNEVTDLTLSGKSDSCFAWCATRGTINFSNFQVKQLTLSYAGIRDAKVWATESLRATIFQTGNVYYKGMPLMQPDYRSSGRLIRF